MDALISGTNGRALLLDAGTLKSFEVDEPAELVPRKPADFAYLFGEMQDLRVLEDTDIESVRQELQQEFDSALALELALISLDAELPDDIRTEAIEGLDELLRDARVAERLENILYARPLPEDGDLGGALQLCTDREFSAASSCLRRLEDRGPFICEVSEAWDSIPTKTFGDYDHQAEFQRTAVREGLFRTLVMAREILRPTSTFLLSAGLNSSVKQLRNHRQVLQAWTTSFRQSDETPAITNEIEEEVETEVAPRRRRGRRVGIDRPAMLREVNGRKAAIVEALHRRDLGLVSRLVEELVDYQRSGETVHVAKSLCDLAMEAKTLGMFALQLKLTDRSIAVAPDDGWSWAQHADALLNMNQLNQALTAYQQASSFGAGVVAKNGRAEVLKAQGQLPAALAAFDDVIREHPENVVARNGRAEVLKAQGQLPAALAAFDDVIRDHPSDVVAKTGRAEVLKAQGQLPAALAAFDDVIREHPENVVAKTGRAEVLKAQGQLPAALAAFDEAIRKHPENVVARNGRAEVLKAQGQLPAALAAFDDVIREHPSDVVAKTGRAEVLKAQGQLPAALAAFDDVIREHPSDVVAKTGRAEVLKAQGQLPAALAAYDEIIELHPKNVIAQNGRAEVLKSKGRLDDALAAYDEITELHPQNVIAQNGRAEVLKSKGCLDDALAAYDEVLLRFPDNDIARNGRACVLAALGRFDEALKLLSYKPIVNLQVWIGQHIRGMILLRMGRRNEAIGILNAGLQGCPWPFQKEYFRAALVVAWLRGGDFTKAKEHLDDVKLPELQPVANVLRLHVFGAQRNVQSANDAFQKLTATPFYSNQLTQELRRRFLLHEQPHHNDEWISDQEVNLFLLAA